MPVTPNPPAFVEAVHDYLAGAEEQFNYQQLLHTFLDNERFHRWAALLDRLHPLAGAHVLSSGCGYAGSVLAYHDAGAGAAIGVDIDAQSVAMGRLRVADVPGAEVLSYDGVHLPFGDASFDVIESMDVIEHTDDPRDYVVELLRVLAPGGLILLVTPNRLWPVEQHLNIWGPPWLPVSVADTLFSRVARLPWLSEDRRFRYARLQGIRTQNMSFLRLRRLAHELDLFLTLPLPHEHPVPWPLPPEPAWAARLQRHRLGKFIAPVRTLLVTLTRRG